MPKVAIAFHCSRQVHMATNIQASLGFNCSTRDYNETASEVYSTVSSQRFTAHLKYVDKTSCINDKLRN